MKFGVLGPLEIDGRAAERSIPPGRQHQVLAVLLSRAGGVVSLGALVDALWPEDPPVGAKANVRIYVSRLRQALGDGKRIVWSSAGYQLALQPDELDAAEFESLLQQARAARRSGDPEHSAQLLADALDLWRGDPYAGLEAYVGPEITRLNQLRANALTDHVELALDLGRHAEVAPRLSELVAKDPDNERLVALLMMALYRLDRQTDALALYRRTRKILHDRHAVEPGNELRRLHGAILRRDPNLDHPATTRRQQVQVVVPAQLPADIRAFAGREVELRQLDSLLDNERPETVVISAVSGTAGIGKTALAVHWAHRIRDRFPDGQLYVNLRGFDPSGTVMKPTDAIRGLLDALGVAPERIPADLDTQAALYRSLLNGKRVLAVLDNARDTDQIRPLLPGSAGCLAIATSRNNLAGLVTKEAAHPLTLDLLPNAEARLLLERRVGSDRISAAPEAINDIIAACAGLPLVLAIVAARAAAHPHFPFQALAHELRHTGLDALAGEADTDVRTVFSWSYAQLTPPAQQLFRFLGLHPGPDISPPAAASLIGLPAGDLRQALTELTNAHLVNEYMPGRHILHDLLRAYAAELTRTRDNEDDRHATVHRVLDHYLHTAHAADRQLNPTRDPLVLTPPLPGVTPERVDNYDQAMAWFGDEQPVLLTCIDHAAKTGFDTHAWQLVWSLYVFLSRRGKWQDLTSAGHTALKATQRLGDRPTQAKTHRLLAAACTELGRFDDAHTHLQHALTLSIGLGDQTGQAHALRALGRTYGLQGHYTEALDHAQKALALFEAAGHRHGLANTLNSIGWDHAQLGHHQQALEPCARALKLFQELGDRDGEAATWDSLGYAHHHLGQHDAATGCYQHALSFYRDVGHLYYQASTLRRLGDTQHAVADIGAARQSLQQALTILTDLDHPDADNVRARLNELDRIPPDDQEPT